MGKAVVVLHSGPGVGREHLLCLESARCLNTPDSAARDLCRAVERLSPGARKLWDRARSKKFDVGYDLPADFRTVQVTLRAATVRAIVALGGTVAFTCYREDKTNLGTALTVGPALPPGIQEVWRGRLR